MPFINKFRVKKHSDPLAFAAFLTAIFYLPPFYFFTLLLAWGITGDGPASFYFVRSLVQFLLVIPFLPTVLTLISLRRLRKLRSGDKSFLPLIPAGVIILLSFILLLINFFS